ncbi:MAG: sigma-54 dependent transcriptional regulator [Acidobacteriota bacterium]
MARKPSVLIIDDETGSRESMAIALEKADFEVRTFDDARNALKFIAEDPTRAQVAVCDLKMPNMDGLEFLAAVREEKHPLAVILVTAFGSIDSAVEAMRVGADDYLPKPVDLYELRTRVSNLVEKERLREEVTSLREQLDKRFGFENIIGKAPAMETLFEKMRMVAPTRASVLVIGESGTGKELVANALHHASPRKSERFLAINCGAIPSDILESELFGHEKGAFTGAVSRKIGKFELAHRGTLFLDEISELYPELQVKLLRVLEERQVMRVGGADLLDVDFRLVAATNRDLEEEVEKGRFREDLYYRLKVVTLEIPSLRERPSDIPLLADFFLKQYCDEQGKEPRALSPEAQEVFSRFPWPGNVRELRNRVESIVVFHQGEEITLQDLPADMRDSATVSSAGAPVQPVTAEPRTMAEIERQAILETLQRTEGHRAKAADLLDIGLRTLQRKLKDYKEQGYVED